MGKSDYFGGGIIESEFYMYWLDSIKEFNFYTYTKLMKCFENSEKIYICSKNYYKFIKSLNSKNVKIEKKILDILTNSNYKKECLKKFKILKEKNIKIISIENKLYPKFLLELNLPMLCLYYKGDINLLNKNYKKVFIYNNGKNNNYYSYVLFNFYTTLLQFENLLLLESSLNNNKVIKEDIHINNVEFESLYYNKNKNLNNEYKLEILVDKEKYDFIYFYDVIACFSDFCLIPKADYNKFITIYCDLMLEKGKDILVCPGGIYSHNTYFSNYLIKEGAKIVLNKNDVVDYIFEN